MSDREVKNHERKWHKSEDSSLNIREKFTLVLMVLSVASAGAAIYEVQRVNSLLDDFERGQSGVVFDAGLEERVEMLENMICDSEVGLQNGVLGIYGGAQFPTFEECMETLTEALNE